MSQLKHIALAATFFALAFFILFVSVLRTAAVTYEFSMPSNGNEKVLGEEGAYIDYSLPFHGKVMPDSVLWPVKAARDNIWLAMTTNPGRVADLYLLFADKRLGASKVLFDNGNPEDGFKTLLKAEMYLQLACDKERENYEKEMDTTEFLRRLSLSSLKHREVIEEIIIDAPEDAVPEIVQAMDYPKNVYEKTVHALNERGMDAPENPFDGG